MSNDTTTVASAEEQPQEDGQAEQTIEASAESLRADSGSTEQPQTQEPETTEEVADDNSNETQVEETDSSDDLKEWARSKGVDPDDPVALAKLAKDTEKGFRQYSEKAKAEANELKNKVADSDYLTDNEAVIQEARINNFYFTNPEARKYDVKMGEIYARFAKRDPDFASHLARNLDTLYAMAKVEDSSEEVMNARQQGKVEATQAIKKAQTASAPKANATASQPASRGLNEEKIQEIIASGKYDEHREEILAYERSLFN
jgi:hypothetical protein